MTEKLKLFFDWTPNDVDSLLDIGCGYPFMLHLLSAKSRKSFDLNFDKEKVVEAR